MSGSLRRGLQRLATRAGGTAALARRCGVTDAHFWRWMSGDEQPSSDETLLLELIAKNEGVTLLAASTAPPRTSEMRVTGAPEDAPTFEDYAERVRRR